MIWNFYPLSRFVLEHKIEELKQQIMPKDDMILDLRSQVYSFIFLRLGSTYINLGKHCVLKIDAMEDELNDVTRSQTELAVQLEDTKSKLTSTTTDLTSERKRSVI